MDLRNLNDVLDWIRKTDLVEVRFKKDSDGFEFRSEDAPPDATAFSASALAVVASPGIGVFRWGKPGAPKGIEEGKSVAAGASLGLVEMGSKALPVSADAGGRVLKVLVQDGSPVEYGQTLFILSP